MTREQFNARLTPAYAEQAKAFAEQHGMRKGEAAQRLMERGLDAWEDQDADPDTTLEVIASALAVAALVSLWAFVGLAGFFDWAVVEPVLVTGGLTLVYIGAAIVTNWRLRRREA